MADLIEIRSGAYAGQLRSPKNEGRATTGNIHSDDDARRLGFRGGLVAGSIHMEQFAPLLVRAFSERFLERGSLSLYFLSPTLHGEPVRAFVGVPPEGAADAQVEAWAERESGERICEGTAAVGDPQQPSALRARQLNRFEAVELRILGQAHAGDSFPEVEVSITPDLVEQRLRVITEPMPWYSEATPWGGIVPPAVVQVNALARPAYAYLDGRRAAAIGLYGAIELRNVNGPMLVGESYRGGGTLLAAGESPKTEYVWFDSWADDRSGKRIAEMRMLLRFMKASSPAYAEAKAGDL